GPEGMEALAPHVGHLEFFDFWSNEVTFRGVAALLPSPLLARTRRLDLRYSALDPEGGEQLAEAEELWHIHELIVSSNRLQARGTSALARSPHIANLRVFRLGGNSITDAGARALVKSPYLEQIRLLDIGHNLVGPEVRAALRQRFGERVVMT